MRILRFSLTLYVITLYIVIIASYVVDSYSKNYLYTNLIDIPSNKVGVLLGTSKYSSSGAENNYFTYRIDAAEKLFYSSKISYILVSGDNATVHYNEPITIKNELMKRGIPADRIILDYAGFRTFDSMIRAHKVFGQDKFTVISQPFHNERAIFIARKNGIEAIGYNAKDVSYQNGFNTRLREQFARIKVLLDIYILNTQPKFLGEKINIP